MEILQKLSTQDTVWYISMLCMYMFMHFYGKESSSYQILKSDFDRKKSAALSRKL